MEHTVPGVLVVVGVEDVVVIAGAKKIRWFVRILIASKFSFWSQKAFSNYIVMTAYQGHFHRKYTIV